MKIQHLPLIEKRPLSSIADGRPATLLTTEPVWHLTKDTIDINPKRTIYVDRATVDYMDGLIPLCEGEVVYGVGGGLAIDAAKYVASKCEMPLIAVPTILSTDAFLTDATGVRVGGCVRYLSSKPPELVIVDIDVLRSAPPAMRASGAADVLSIATGMWDWQEAERLGKNPPDHHVTPQAIEIGKAILQTLLDNAREIGKGTPEGLTILLELLCMEVQLCYLCGHSRVEEGSEHHFVYALENRLTGHALHGDLVGLGILLMSSLQSQTWHRYRHALDCLNINYRPAAVTTEAIIDTLVSLFDYVHHHQLPYTIVAGLAITQDVAEATVAAVLD